jgi:hypothetical protein
MLNLFKLKTSLITSYLESNSDIEKLMVGIPVDIEILLKLVNNQEITKVVFESVSQKYVKIQQAFDNYTSNDQILVYIDTIELYVLFNDVMTFTIFTNNLKKCSSRVNIYQIIKKEFKQKLVVNIIDENCIKMTQSLANNAEIIVEKTSNFLWEITFGGAIYENYNAVKKVYDELISNIDQAYVGRIFLTPILRKKFDEYTRLNINSIYIQPTSKIIKNSSTIVEIDIEVKHQSDQNTTVEPILCKRMQTLIKNNQSTIDWIHKNPPEDAEQKVVYYGRYITAISAGKPPSQSTFTSCMKYIGYDEQQKNGKQFWVMNRVSLL